MITFAEWYESKIGISLEEAKRRGVTDLGLFEEAWNSGREMNAELLNLVEAFRFAAIFEGLEQNQIAWKALCDEASAAIAKAKGTP